MRSPFLTGLLLACRFVRRHWLALSIPVVALTYGSGDHYGWWDLLLGRAAVSRAVERLASPEGFPRNFIYANDPDFGRLERFVSAHTSNTVVLERVAKGKRPTFITRVGGGEIKILTPPGWPQFTMVPGESPIIYSYDAAPRQIGTDIQWAASVAEVRRWLDSERETERAVVNVILIGILSIVVVIYESRTEKKSSA